MLKTGLISNLLISLSLEQCEANTRCVSFQKCHTAMNFGLANGSDFRKERHQKMKEMEQQTCLTNQKKAFCCKPEEISKEDLTEKYGKSIISLTSSNNQFSKFQIPNLEYLQRNFVYLLDQQWGETLCNLYIATFSNSF